jgi:virulence-associated protein VagC
MSILAYILDDMAERAKIFMNGGSQAVRLPKSCRFPDGVKEVNVRCDGGKVILEQADEWSEEFLALLRNPFEGEIPLPPRRRAKFRNPFTTPIPKSRKRSK